MGRPSRLVAEVDFGVTASHRPRASAAQCAQSLRAGSSCRRGARCEVVVVVAVRRSWRWLAALAPARPPCPLKRRQLSRRRPGPQKRSLPPPTATVAAATPVVTSLPTLPQQLPRRPCRSRRRHPPPRQPPRRRAATPSGPLIELLAGGGSEAVTDGALALDVQLNRPSGISVGPNGDIWITDANLSIVMRLTPDGLLTDISGGMTGPEDVDVAADGTVYVAERGGYRILAVGENGNLQRIAGDEFSAGFRGDGGPARRALLSQPNGVASRRRRATFTSPT